MSKTFESSLNLENLFYLIYANGGIFNPFVLLQLSRNVKTKAELLEISNLYANYSQVNGVFMELFPKILDFARGYKVSNMDFLSPIDILNLLKNPQDVTQPHFKVGGYTDIRDNKHIKEFVGINSTGHALICSIPDLLPVDCSDFKVGVYSADILYNVQFDGVGLAGELINPVFYCNRLSTISPVNFPDVVI